MKRTIVKILLMLSILFVSVGSTVAYLTDVDKEVNVMTLDRVEIDLIEEKRTAAGTLVEFQDHHPLFPGFYPKGLDTYDTDGYWVNVKNAVDKVVTVKNTGRAPAYVRLWFAFEVTDDDKFINKIHLNRNTTDWQWKFMYDNTTGNFDFLTQDGSRYVVATATYNKVLASGATTPVSLRQVLLDSSATNDDLVKLGDKYSIFVVAQGMQSAGFDKADQALNEGFGVPSGVNHPFAGMGEDAAGESDDVLVISTAEELMAFARAVSGGEFSFTNQTVVLSNDIDMTGYIWPSISFAYGTHQFTGVFDGQGHTISNLNNSLFSDVGAVNGGSLVIRNINIDGGCVKDYGSMGAILDRANGSIIVSIENCHVSNMTIIGESQEDDYYTYAGAIAGRMSYGSIKNCSAQNCTIYTIYGAGNLVGEAWGTTFTNCTTENVQIFLDNNGVVSDYNPGITSCDTQNGIIHNQLLYKRKDSFEDGWYYHNGTCYTCGKVLSLQCSFTCLSDSCTYCGRTKPEICYHVKHQWVCESIDAQSHRVICTDCNELRTPENHHAYCLEAKDGICAGCGTSGVTIGNQWHYEGYKNITATTHDYGCLVCDYVESTEEHRYYGDDTQCRLCDAILPVTIGRIVNADSVALREGPGTGYAYSQRLEVGTLLRILTVPATFDKNHWVKVYYNDEIGYMRGDYVYPEAKYTPGEKMAKSVNDVAIYQDSHLNSSIITTLPAGTTVNVISTFESYSQNSISTFHLIEYEEMYGYVPTTEMIILSTDGNPASDFEYEIADGSITITGYTGTDADVVIPAMIDNLPVTSIGFRAFAECSILNSITLSANTISIGEKAFTGCQNLTRVILPSSYSLTSIGANSFAHCPKLSTFDDWWYTSNLVSIGDYAFTYCSSLSYVLFHQNVSCIGTDVFYGCPNITVETYNNTYATEWCISNQIPVSAGGDG